MLSIKTVSRYFPRVWEGQNQKTQKICTHVQKLGTSSPKPFLSGTLFDFSKTPDSYVSAKVTAIKHHFEKYFGVPPVLFFLGIYPEISGYGVQKKVPYLYFSGYGVPEKSPIPILL